MTKETTHPHPNPSLYRVQQYGGALLLAVMLLTVPLQVVIALGADAGLFILTAGLTLLLTMPVIMLLTVSPPVTVSKDGLTLKPLIGPERLIAWQDVVAVKDYTLLPQPDQEMERRALQGKRNYQAAQGKMLVVRGLPFYYRCAGFFAGEGGQPLIALTNRTHTGYDQLIKRVQHYAASAIAEDAL